jgi:hypothetical protein
LDAGSLLYRKAQMTFQSTGRSQQLVVVDSPDEQYGASNPPRETVQ